MGVIKAVGYVRVSTDTQARDGAGLEAQRAAIEAFAQYKHNADGWEMGKIYVDAGVSGACANRPDFDKLMAGARAGVFNVIVCAYLSRFGRNMRDLLNNVQELDTMGVRLVCVKEGLDTGDTGTGRLMLHILGAVTEYERDLIRERMLGGKAVKQSAGDIYEGSPPFGYRYAGGFKFEEDPVQAPVVRRIATMYVDTGLSSAKITATLRGEGVKKISGTSIGLMIKNPVYYTGKLTRTGYNGKELTYTLPPLITATQWEQMQARRMRNKHKAKRGGGNTEDFWLRDALRCWRCGDVLKPRVVRQNGKTWKYYGCISKTSSNAHLQLRGRTRCALPFVAKDDIELEVWYHVVKLLTFSTNETRLVAGIMDPARWEEQINKLNGQAAGVRQTIENKTAAKTRLFALLERPDFTDAQMDDFTKRLTALDAEIADLNAKLAEVTGQINNVAEAQKNEALWRDFAEHAPAMLRDLEWEIGLLPPAARKTLVEAMLDGGIMVDGEPNAKRGKPGIWGLSNLPKHVNIGALSELADAGLLPVLKTAGRK